MIGTKNKGWKEINEAVYGSLIFKEFNVTEQKCESKNLDHNVQAL